jgi:SAM-dependent methyltransferase
VFELGCGTGRFAARLLWGRLPADAHYLGVDVSPRMVALASDRVARWAPRAEVMLIEPPGQVLPGGGRAFDRFVATYVFELLAEDYARSLLAEAGRLVAPDGLLCLTSLTHGVTPGGRLVARGWGALARRWPALLGGCRPIELADLLPLNGWRIEHREVLTRWGVPSEMLVARLTDKVGGG